MFLVCKSCLRALRVIGNDAATEALIGVHSCCADSGYPCPDCLQPMQVLPEDRIDADEHFTLRIADVTPEEAFVAFNGLGLPDEQVCSLSVLRKLFQQPVKQLVGRDLLGTTRCCIDHLEFEDGSRVYFGASPQGAVAYRVAAPPAYTKKVLYGG